jgi:crossover junction endodeoxyribonuclease RuvC
VLGIDPGLVETGFGVVEGAPAGPSLLDAGVIVTSPRAPLEARLEVLHGAVHRLLDRFAPGLLVVEDLYAEYGFPRTALLMAHARGVICLAARQRGVPLLSLAPAEVKRALAAHGAASKGQVQRSVQRLLGLAALPRPSHVADALGLAVTGLSRAGGRLRA